MTIPNDPRQYGCESPAVCGTFPEIAPGLSEQSHEPDGSGQREVSGLVARIHRLDELYLAADRALTRFLNGTGSHADYRRARRRYSLIAARAA